MYSSVSEAEYQFRRSKAEDEARRAYDRSSPSKAPPAAATQAGQTAEASSARLQSRKTGGSTGIFSRLKEDDILLIGILFLLFNENKYDDPLILIILAVLLFN